jgi:hypothetical protein
MTMSPRSSNGPIRDPFQQADARRAALPRVSETRDTGRATIDASSPAGGALPNLLGLGPETGGGAEDPDRTPPRTPGAVFPEVPTWSDEQLITAIELADRREPALKLNATAELPDRYDALLDACSAELVRRLEARSERLSA